MEDIGDEGISGIEGLPPWLAGTLSRSEEIMGGHLPLKFRQEAFLPEHAKDITESNAPVVDRMEGVKRRGLASLVDRGEKVTGPRGGQDSKT